MKTETCKINGSEYDALASKLCECYSVLVFCMLWSFGSFICFVSLVPIDSTFRKTCLVKFKRSRTSCIM